MEEITRDIIERAAGGDMEAFEAIYKAVSGLVFNLALRITNSRPDAEEATQDIFLKIYDNLRYFEFRSSFKTWVYRIAANTAINVYNKNIKERLRRVDFDTVIETTGNSSGIREAAQSSDARKLLSSLLESLTPEHRAAIVLREIEGLSYEEIARALGEKLNTVRTRLKRARQALLELAKKAVQNELR
jgi:RNA polymerase sigma-70 factor (ECF subfamily)